MGYLNQDQDVVRPWIKESPQRWMSPHRKDKDTPVRVKVANKMSKLVARGYIREGVILVLAPFLSVSKVTEDICMVLDTTVSRLNDYLWATNFMLPPMDILLMMVGPNTHMINLDVGEMFYNF